MTEETAAFMCAGVAYPLPRRLVAQLLAVEGKETTYRPELLTMLDWAVWAATEQHPVATTPVPLHARVQQLGHITHTGEVTDLGGGALLVKAKRFESQPTPRVVEYTYRSEAAGRYGVHYLSPEEWAEYCASLEKQVSELTRFEEEQRQIRSTAEREVPGYRIDWKPEDGDDNEGAGDWIWTCEATGESGSEDTRAEAIQAAVEHSERIPFDDAAAGAPAAKDESLPHKGGAVYMEDLAPSEREAVIGGMGAGLAPGSPLGRNDEIPARLDFTKPPPGYQIHALMGAEGRNEQTGETFVVPTTYAAMPPLPHSLKCGRDFDWHTSRETCIKAAWEHYKQRHDPPNYDGPPASRVSLIMMDHGREDWGDPSARWTWYETRLALADRLVWGRLTDEQAKAVVARWDRAGGAKSMADILWPQILTASDEQVFEVNRWLVDSTAEMPEVLRG